MNPYQLGRINGLRKSSVILFWMPLSHSRILALSQFHRVKNPWRLLFLSSSSFPLSSAWSTSQVPRAPLSQDPNSWDLYRLLRILSSFLFLVFQPMHAGTYSQLTWMATHHREMVPPGLGYSVLRTLTQHRTKQPHNDCRTLLNRAMFSLTGNGIGLRAQRMGRFHDV